VRVVEASCESPEDSPRLMLVDKGELADFGVWPGMRQGISVAELSSQSALRALYIRCSLRSLWTRAETRTKVSVPCMKVVTAQSPATVSAPS
jgi:hypothetical protein